MQSHNCHYKIQFQTTLILSAICGHVAESSVIQILQFIIYHSITIKPSQTLYSPDKKAYFSCKRAAISMAFILGSSLTVANGKGGWH